MRSAKEIQARRLIPPITEKNKILLVLPRRKADRSEPNMTFDMLKLE